MYSSFDLVYSPTGVDIVLNLVFSLCFKVFKRNLKDIIVIRVLGKTLLIVADTGP